MNVISFEGIDFKMKILPASGTMPSLRFHPKGKPLKNSLTPWPKEWPVVHSRKTVEPYHVSNTTMQIKLIDFLATSQ